MSSGKQRDASVTRRWARLRFSIIGPLLDYLDQADAEHNDGQQATVILPEFVPAHWWQALLHNQTTWMIKTALLYRRRTHGYQRVIIDVPYHLKK